MSEQQHAALPVVGKSTVAPTIDALNEYQRHGGRCEENANGSADCFLDSGQRARLICWFVAHGFLGAV